MSDSFFFLGEWQGQGNVMLYTDNVNSTDQCEKMIPYEEKLSMRLIKSTPKAHVIHLHSATKHAENLKPLHA
eukprot:Pgem_evm1s19235